MRGISPEKKDLLLRLGDRLGEFGINAYTLDLRQLKTFDTLLTTMDRMAAEYSAKKAELESMALTKESIAAATGISMSTLTHDINVMRLIRSYAQISGMETDVPQTIDPAIAAKDKKIGELETQIMVLEHKLESLDKLSLDMFAKEKIIDGLRNELTLAKKSIDAYYGQLDEIKSNDISWADKINTLFQNNSKTAS